MRLHILRPRLGHWATSLIVGLFAACIVVGWNAVDAAKRQAVAVSRVSRTHGAPEYRFAVPVPHWCVSRFGPDLFARVISVSYFEWGVYPPHAPQNYHNYMGLCDLPHLEEIDVLDSFFPVDVLEHISTLRRLTIVRNGLRDIDMNVISKLHGIRMLSLRINDITDSGAQKLSRLHNLTELDLTGNFVSSEMISELQISLPHCRIRNDWSRADILR